MERRNQEKRLHWETKAPLAALLRERQPQPGSNGVGGCVSFFEGGAEVTSLENVSYLT